MRLGQGDFSTSIPPGGAAEVGALARTMEDMRRNLVDLTSTLRRREAEAQAVLAGIVEGVYAVDKNRIIRYLNPQAARLLGVRRRRRRSAASAATCSSRCDEDGRRPCEFDCPILQARTQRQRARPSSGCRSTTRRAAHDRHHQLRHGRMACRCR